MSDEARNHYLERLSAEFFKFRESNVLCDTTLITTDGLIPAHSIVLAAASSVFRDAFKTSGCEDSGSYQLELPGISGALAEAVLSLCYTGSSNLSVRDVTSHSLLSEMCQQLGINLVSNKLTDAWYEDILIMVLFIGNMLLLAFGSCLFCFSFSSNLIAFLVVVFDSTGCCKRTLVYS